jgi:hypothetical protein
MSEIGIGVTLSAHYAGCMANHDLILYEHISVIWQSERMRTFLVCVVSHTCLSKLITFVRSVYVFVWGTQSKQGQSQNAAEQIQSVVRAADGSLGTLDPSINHCRSTLMKGLSGDLTDGLPVCARHNTRV